MDVKRMLRYFLKSALIMLGTVAFYALFGFVIIPAVLKAELPDVIKEQTGRTSSVGKIVFNPFTLQFGIDQFSIQEHGGPAFVAFNRLSGNVGFIDSVKYWALVLDDVHLDKPYVRIARTETGSFNFADLLASEKAAEPEVANGLFPFLIRNFDISEGSVVWEDFQLAQPEREVIAPIDLSLSELSTLDADPSGLHLTLTLSSGARLSWTGNIVIEPFQSKGSLKLEQLSLSRLSNLFLQRTAPIILQSGTAGLSADYEFIWDDRDFSLDLTDAALHVNGLKLSEKKQAGIPNIAVGAMALNADYRIRSEGQETLLDVGKIRLNIGDFAVQGTKNSPGVPN
ncbi:MAG: DUF748 domain-containing protein, partial [Gammaproteobacteria bacterium]